MRIIPLAFVALAWLTALSLPAAAQSTAYTTADVNMREGPGSRYEVIVVIPVGSSVLVHQCLTNRRWCDVTWRDNRGYVYARYLSSFTSDYAPRYSPPQVIPPAVLFEYEHYGDRVYSPHFRYRDRYHGPNRLYRDGGKRRKYKKRRDRRKIDKSRKRRLDKPRDIGRKLKRRTDRRLKDGNRSRRSKARRSQDRRRQELRQRKAE